MIKKNADLDREKFITGNTVSWIPAVTKSIRDASSRACSNGLDREIISDDTYLTQGNDDC